MDYSGKKDGLTEGYNNGKTDGVKEGYANGKKDGMVTGINNVFDTRKVSNWPEGRELPIEVHYYTSYMIDYFYFTLSNFDIYCGTNNNTVSANIPRDYVAINLLNGTPYIGSVKGGSYWTNYFYIAPTVTLYGYIKDKTKSTSTHEEIVVNFENGMGVDAVYNNGVGNILVNGKANITIDNSKFKAFAAQNHGYGTFWEDDYPYKEDILTNEFVFVLTKPVYVGIYQLKSFQ